MSSKSQIPRATAIFNNMSWLRRFNFVSTSSHVHLIKFEFWEMKYRLMAFLMLAESKLKSWIIKYGRRDSVELFLQNYIVRPPAFLINSFNLLYKNWFDWYIMKHLSHYCPLLHRLSSKAISSLSNMKPRSRLWNKRQTPTWNLGLQVRYITL